VGKERNRQRQAAQGLPASARRGLDRFERRLPRPTALEAIAM